jgi:SEC-C motif-containing protein
VTSCPCGSGLAYADCCEPYVTGAVPAPTPEALMRSRYSAFVVHAVDYLGETLHPGHREDWDREATRRWSESADWRGLTIVDCEQGGPDDDAGVVEFIAEFVQDGEPQRHQERSIFRRHRGRWYYVDGELPKPETLRHATPKVGRNDPCPCGSGRKYKKCCGA